MNIEWLHTGVEACVSDMYYIQCCCFEHGSDGTKAFPQVKNLKSQQQKNSRRTDSKAISMLWVLF